MKIKNRRKLLIIVELVVFALCGLLMYLLQSRLFYKNADREIDLTFRDMDRIVEQMEADSDQNYDSYELIHSAKAKMAKYYIRNDEDTGYSASSMKKLKQLLNVTNVYLVDGGGKVTYGAEKSAIDDFVNGEVAYFDKLQEVAGTNGTAPFEYAWVREDEDGDVAAYHSFCGVSLNNGRYVVIEDDAEGLYELQDESSSWEAVLPRITLGRNGFVFALGWDGWVSSFSDPDETQITYVTGLGIEMSDVRDGFRGTLNLQGDDYYCGAKYYSDEQTYVICAIPSGEITSNVLVVTAVPLFVAFIFLSLQLLYSMMIVGERDEKDSDGNPIPFRKFLIKKMAMLLVLSVFFSVGSSLYTQVLYSMYLQAYSAKLEAEVLAQSLSSNDELQRKTSEEYYTDLGNLTTLAAKFISNNPQITRKNLADIARNLGAEHVLLYDRTGTVILSDAYYRDLKISMNPRELSHEFTKVLTGTQVLAQQEVDETYLEKPYRYVGAIVTDEDDELNGFVQLAFDPDYLATSLRETTIESLPSTFSGRNNAFAFIVDGEKKTFLYYPSADLTGESVADYGLTDEMMLDDYYSRTHFDGEERLLYCDFWDDDIIFTAASVNVITMESVSRGVLIAIAGIVIQLLFFAALLFIYGDDPADDDDDDMRDVPEERVIEDHRTLVEKVAASRIMKLLRVSFFAFTGVISVIMLLRELLFGGNEVLLDLLNGRWNTGVHVFSVTACWISICMVYFCVSLVLLALELIGKLMNSRGETVIRMLISFTRYIAVIGTGFYCAGTLGAATDTLLASAGILTVVIGLGAQSLVTDVLAGLFIIFEKSYKVGDVIRIDGESWRGRVMEIGIRNTRVMDIDENNVKIIHNSTLNHIINLSELPTYVYTTIGIEYGESLQRVEDVIARELPGMRGRIPAAIEGPRYSGVSELGDSAVILKFATLCRNEDYFRVKFAVNRELKLMFDRNSINVPFPQVVINKREE